MFDPVRLASRSRSASPEDSRSPAAGPTAKISRKIGWGYALSLGIATLGTAIAATVGQVYLSRSQALRADTLEALRLVNRFETSLLAARIHQQNWPGALDRPVELREQYKDFQEHALEAQEVWAQLLDRYEDRLAVPPSQDSEAVTRLRSLIDNEAGIPDGFVAQGEAIYDRLLAAGVQAGNGDGAIAADAARAAQVEAAVAELTAVRLHEFYTDLHEFGRALNRDFEAADRAFQTALGLSRALLVLGLLLAAIAAIAAGYRISRSIAGPVERLTETVRQVADEANYELRATADSNDEVGVLAEAVNRLVAETDRLLRDRDRAAADRLLQSEKMASLGRMLAGVAHELNNPLNFIYGNTINLEDSVGELLEFCDRAVDSDTSPEDLQAEAEELELDFLAEDLPKSIASMKLGAARARELVLSLRNFSRLDEGNPYPTNLHECLDGSLLILHNRLKKGIEVRKNYGDVPPVEAYPGALYQVFTNLIANAIDAMEEEPGSEQVLTLSTERFSSGDAARTGDWAIVRCSDTGPGISEAAQRQIFETFYTTKPAGKGTGLGLPIVRDIVEVKHGGRLTVQSSPGAGATFAVWLPIQQSSAAAPRDRAAVERSPA